MTQAVEKSASLKFNPVRAVYAKPEVEYAPSQLIILDSQNISLAGSKLQHNYVLGGHIDADPMYTAFAPETEHAGLLIAGAKMDSPIFIGNYPDLKAESPETGAPTLIQNGRFVLVEGRGYKFEIIPALTEVPTAYIPENIGKGPSLSKANFHKAVVINTDFSGCNLEGANFAEANLKGCNFTGANLSKASFNGANLSEARLIGCDLSEVDLGGAVTSDETDFSFAYLVGAQFYPPTGKKHPYLGKFEGTIFTDGQQRIEVSNADFKQITGLVDNQFACFYKFDISLPANVKCLSTNRYAASRTSG